MTVEEMRQKKIEHGYTNEMVAELSGVPLGTVQKIFGGKTAAPRYETLRKLEKLLMDSLRQAPVPGEPSEEPLEEASDEERPRKRYTGKDYEALPEERRAELIDGVFYDLDAPSCSHQRIVRELSYLLMKYVKEQKEPSEVFASPCDVRLDPDDDTIVQPDILVVCDRKRLRGQRRQRLQLQGAPDLVIEISSPFTRKKDIGLKCRIYMHAGVREYWIVDPDRQQLLVYPFLEGDDMFPSIYKRGETLPVAIWGGALSINLEEFWSEIDYWEGDGVQDDDLS